MERLVVKNLLEKVKNYTDRIYLRYLKSFDSDIYKVKTCNLTYLSIGALRDIKKVIKRCEYQKLKGIFIEAGCALGGSAIVISKSKSKERSFHIYDVFGMIPEPTAKDGEDVHDRYDTIIHGKSKGLGGETYYGYIKNLKAGVIQSFKNFNCDPQQNNIILHEGLFNDTLFIKEEVAFAHIDADWYESVMMCLTRIEPYLVRNGVIIIDDYYDWSGCRMAVDDYFKENKGKYKFIKKTKLHIIKR